MSFGAGKRGSYSNLNIFSRNCPQCVCHLGWYWLCYVAYLPTEVLRDWYWVCDACYSEVRAAQTSPKDMLYVPAEKEQAEEAQHWWLTVEILAQSCEKSSGRLHHEQLSVFPIVSLVSYSSQLSLLLSTLLSVIFSIVIFSSFLFPIFSSVISFK